MTSFIFNKIALSLRNYFLKRWDVNHQDYVFLNYQNDFFEQNRLEPEKLLPKR